MNQYMLCSGYTCTHHKRLCISYLYHVTIKIKFFHLEYLFFFPYELLKVMKKLRKTVHNLISSFKCKTIK